MLELKSCFTGFNEYEVAVESDEHLGHGFLSMHGKNRPLVTDELVEFEKLPIEMQDFGKITHHFRGIYGMHLRLI